MVCHTSARMHTNAYIFKKLGFTTTIQEYFAEHYTIIQNDLKKTSNYPQTWFGGTKPKAFKVFATAPLCDGVPRHAR